MDPVTSLRDWQDITLDDDSCNEIASDLNSMVQMTSNLSEQVEYSNSLLKQINKLESTNADLSQETLAGENEIYELKEILNESQHCILNLQSKLKASEDEKDKLTSSNSRWGDEKENLSSQLEQLRSEKEIMTKRAEEQATDQLLHLEKISELEVKIQSLEHHEQESNRVGSSLNSRLKFENEKLAADLEASKSVNASFHDNYNSLRDENVSLKKSLERLMRLNNDETLEKEELSKRNKSITSQNVALSDDLQDAMERCVEFEQEHDRLSTALAESRGHVAQLNDEAEEHMRAKRVMEEELDQSRDQIADCQEELAQLQAYANELKNQLYEADQLRLEQEADTEKQQAADAQQDQERVAELSHLLSVSAQRLREDRLGYEEAVAKLNGQVAEYQASIDTQRQEHDKLVSNALRARDEAVARLQSLESTTAENNLLLQRYSEDERERRRELLDQIQALGDRNRDNCNRFQHSLSSVQQVVRELCADVMAERNKLRTLSTQHMKLRGILLELTRRAPAEPKFPSPAGSPGHTGSQGNGGSSSPSAANASTSSDTTCGSSPAASVLPLVQYGDVISGVLQALSAKYTAVCADKDSLRNYVNELQGRLKEEQARAQQFNRNCDAAMEQVAVHRKGALVLESRAAELQQTNKALSAALGQEKKNCGDRVAKLEAQLSEHTSHNIKLQNDITRVTADCNHMHAQEDQRNAHLAERVKTLEAECTRVREDSKGLDQRKTALQMELMAAESKLMKLQEEFQKLRKGSLGVAEQATQDHKKYTRHVEALTKNVAQYRNQIGSLQQLNATLQKQRDSLTEEMQALRQKQSAAPAPKVASPFPRPPYGSSGYGGSSSSSSSTISGLVAANTLSPPRGRLAKPNLAKTSSDSESNDVAPPTAAGGASEGLQYHGNGDVLLSHYTDSIRNLTMVMNSEGKE